MDGRCITAAAGIMNGGGYDAWLKWGVAAAAASTTTDLKSKQTKNSEHIVLFIGCLFTRLKKKNRPQLYPETIHAIYVIRTDKSTPRGK